MSPVLSVAEDPQPKKTNYIIYPAKTDEERKELRKNLTELQRSRPPWSKEEATKDKVITKYSIVINGSAAIREDKTIDAKALDLAGLERTLHVTSKIIFAGDPKEGIAITVVYSRPRPTKKVAK